MTIPQKLITLVRPLNSTIPDFGPSLALPMSCLRCGRWCRARDFWCRHVREHCFHDGCLATVLRSSAYFCPYLLYFLHVGAVWYCVAEFWCHCIWTHKRIRGFPLASCYFMLVLDSSWWFLCWRAGNQLWDHIREQHDEDVLVSWNGSLGLRWSESDDDIKWFVISRLQTITSKFNAIVK